MQLIDLRRSMPLMLIMVLVMFGCDQEKPPSQAQPSQPASVVDQAAQQAVGAIQAPMDKARGVEETLGQAADRTAETVNSAGE